MEKDWIDTLCHIPCITVCHTQYSVSPCASVCHTKCTVCYTAFSESWAQQGGTGADTLSRWEPLDTRLLPSYNNMRHTRLYVKHIVLCDPVRFHLQTVRHRLPRTHRLHRVKYATYTRHHTGTLVHSATAKNTILHIVSDQLPSAYCHIHKVHFKHHTVPLQRARYYTAQFHLPGQGRVAKL